MWQEHGTLPGSEVKRALQRLIQLQQKAQPRSTVCPWGPGQPALKGVPQRFFVASEHAGLMDDSHRPRMGALLEMDQYGTMNGYR